MARLRLSVAARADLEAIQAVGIAKFGREMALVHMARFEHIFSLLREHPEAGQAHPEYGEGIRAFSNRPHRLLYHYADGEVLIVRVLHAAQRVPALAQGT